MTNSLFFPSNNFGFLEKYIDLIQIATIIDTDLFIMFVLFNAFRVCNNVAFLISDTDH